jgi:hypothetical protein
LSPQPPHIKSLFKSFGLMALLHPQLPSSPSRHDRLMAWTTPAADIAWVKAASRLAVKTKTKLNKKIMKLKTWNFPIYCFYTYYVKWSLFHTQGIFWTYTLEFIYMKERKSWARTCTCDM